MVLEITDEATVREFKEQLRGWHPSQDDLTRRLSKVHVTKASSGRAKLEFLFTKIGVGSKLIWPRDRIDISKERALHPPPPEKSDRINNDPPPPMGLISIEQELI